jgi:hypothetical protein
LMGRNPLSKPSCSFCEAKARHTTRVRCEGLMGRGVCGASGAFKCLRDAVEHDFVVHGGLDVALGAQVLGAVVCAAHGTTRVRTRVRGLGAERGWAARGAQEKS